MSNKLFSPGEMAALKASPYVESVTSRSVCFTPEFKRLVYRELLSAEKRIRQLEAELAYTRQEVEFLKKLQAANMEAQKAWESKHWPK